LPFEAAIEAPRSATHSGEPGDDPARPPTSIGTDALRSQATRSRPKRRRPTPKVRPSIMPATHATATATGFRGAFFERVRKCAMRPRTIAVKIDR